MKEEKNSHIIDVAIIGGGITGLLSAYFLTEAGKRVVLFEKDTVGSGATEATTAFITQAIDTSYADLISAMGKVKTKKIAQSHKEAIDILEKIIKKEEIDCNFMRCPNFLYANSLPEVDDLEKEVEAMKSVGIDAKLNISKGNLGFVNFGYIEMSNQAKFSIKKFIPAITSIIKERGVVIHQHHKVTEITAKNRMVHLKTNGHDFIAKNVIVATYEPFNKPLTLYFKKGFYTTSVISASIPKGIIKEAIYEDTLNPYHYFRIDQDEKNDIITLGGEDHRSALKFNQEKIFSNLENYLKSILPNTSYSIEEKWTGPILEPADGLPSIGKLNKNPIFYAMAFSGNGMTYSAIAATIFTDAIAKHPNPYQNLYSAKRIPNIPSLFIKGRDYGQILIYDIAAQRYKSNR